MPPPRNRNRSYPAAVVRADRQGSFPSIAEFVEVAWGTPSSESSNSIEVLGTCYDLGGSPYLTGEVSVMIVVSDAASSCEPSATATISAAGSPVGTMLAGSGTATGVFKTNASGQFRIRVTEASSGNRFLWVRAGGHAQLFVKARDGIQQLTFT